MYQKNNINFHVTLALSLCLCLACISCCQSPSTITASDLTSSGDNFQQTIQTECDSLQGKFLCIGDSITYGTYIDGVYTGDRSWVQYLAAKSDRISTINGGRSGRDTVSKAEIIPILNKHLDASYVLFFLGVNDLNNASDELLNACITNMKWMIDQTRSIIPNARIVLMAPASINPKTVTDFFRKGGYNEKTQEYLIRLASMYQELARGENLTFIDLTQTVSPSNFTDGIHPSLAGQQQIADKIWRELNLAWYKN